MHNAPSPPKNNEKYQTQTSAGALGTAVLAILLDTNTVALATGDWHSMSDPFRYAAAAVSAVGAAGLAAASTSLLHTATGVCNRLHRH